MESEENIVKENKFFEKYTKEKIIILKNDVKLEFDIKTCKWKSVSLDKSIPKFAVAVKLNKNIIVIGGRCKENEKEPLNTAFEIDPSNKTS